MATAGIGLVKQGLGDVLKSGAKKTSELSKKYSPQKLHDAGAKAVNLAKENPKTAIGLGAGTAGLATGAIIA